MSLNLDSLPSVWLLPDSPQREQRVGRFECSNQGGWKQNRRFDESLDVGSLRSGWKQKMNFCGSRRSLDVCCNRPVLRSILLAFCIVAWEFLNILLVSTIWRQAKAYSYLRMEFVGYNNQPIPIWRFRISGPNNALPAMTVSLLPRARACFADVRRTLKSNYFVTILKRSEFLSPICCGWNHVSSRFVELGCLHCSATAVAMATKVACHSCAPKTLVKLTISIIMSPILFITTVTAVT